MKPEKKSSHSRGVAKMDFRMPKTLELSIFPGKKPQQQKAPFAGYRFSIGNIDGFGVVTS